MNNTPRITAIIPARSGSRRLKDKNIAEINGEPLLARKVRQCLSCPMINCVLVSSDSEEYLRISEIAAMKAGGNIIPHLREREHSDEQSKTFGETVAYLASTCPGEHIAWTPCTAPLLGEGEMTLLSHCYFTALNVGYDSLVAAHKLQTYLMHRDGTPSNYDPRNHMPSQELSPLFAWSGGWWSAPRLSMIEWQYFHGPVPMVADISSPRCDIDTAEDLELARKLLQ